MLQRIQSVFLSLVVLCMCAAVALPLWSNTDPTSGQTISLNAFNIKQVNGTSTLQIPVYYLAVMAFLAAMLSIFTVFQYRNRPKQMLYVALNALLIGALLATSIYLVLVKASQLMPTGTKGQFGLGFYAVFAAVVLNQAASFFIRKDERAVKDADRMR
jgi:glucan phosphoethanolaminetransferase (alkaline phosphatase superfamily)